MVYLFYEMHVVLYGVFLRAKGFIYLLARKTDHVMSIISMAEFLITSHWTQGTSLDSVEIQEQGHIAVASRGFGTHV